MAAEIAVTLQSIFRLSTSGAPSEIQLSPETWRVIAQINGARTISEIAENLKTEPAAVQKAASNLYRLGLLQAGQETDEPARTTVDAAFFAYINAEFIKMIGPFGPILIEDEVSNIGATRDNFPREKVAELVERVSTHITEEARRIRFQQIMLEAIRKS